MLLPDVAGQPTVTLIVVARRDPFECVDAALRRPESLVGCDIRQPGCEHEPRLRWGHSSWPQRWRQLRAGTYHPIKMRTKCLCARPLFKCGS